MSNSEFQKPITGSFTAAAQSVDITSPNQTVSVIQIAGVWTGTLIVEGSNDNVLYYAIPALKNVSDILVSSITASSIYIAQTNGYQYIRMRSSAWTSGTATFTVYGSDAASLASTVSILRGGTDGTIIGNNTNKLLTDGSGVTQPISAVSLPLPTGAATSAIQTAQSTLIGAVNETAPASDTASSGLNGRLQRIAQRLTSLIALIPSAIGTAFFTRISDGVDTAKVTTNNDLSVSDGLKNGGVHGTLSMPTGNTAYEAKVGGSRLAQRKSLIITAQDNMFWGYSNTVTVSTGTPLKKNQTIIFDCDPDSTFQVWLVASANTKTAKIAESP